METLTEHSTRCTRVTSKSERAWVTRYQLAANPVLPWKKAVFLQLWDRSVFHSVRGQSIACEGSRLDTTLGDEFTHPNSVFFNPEKNIVCA